MKLSIITINFNNLKGLKRTYESVACQTWTDFEWIIIDGGSTDGSREFIETHQEKFTYWCSEPDNGVYHAMNKGIAKANGEYLLFLNSGDSLHDMSVLKQVSEIDVDADVLYGNIYLINQNSNQFYHYPNKLSIHYFLYCSIGHPASFIKSSLLKDVGYREDFKIISDWYNFIMWFRQGKTFHHIPLIISDFDTTGISSRNKELLNQEKLVLYNEIFGKENYSWIAESISIHQMFLKYKNKDVDSLMRIRNRGGKRLAILRCILKVFEFNM